MGGSGTLRRIASWNGAGDRAGISPERDMKIKNSLKALMQRDRNNKLVRRKGRVYIINKKAPRFKARQG